MALSNIRNTARPRFLNILFLVALGWGVSGLSARVYRGDVRLIGVRGDFRRPGQISSSTLSSIGELARQMIRYSVVLISNTFMWWIINSSSRVVAAWRCTGSAANGMLAVS